MQSDLDTQLAAYNAVTHDLLGGMGRLAQARIASNTLQSVLLTAALETAHEDAELDTLRQSPFGDLLELTAGEMRAFKYLSNTSHLVYATTLLDSYLSDTTAFLHLLYPKSMGRQQPLTLDDILAAGCRSEIITNLALKKARDISYSSFRDRASYLEKTFGLALSVDRGTWAQVDHFIGIRNVVVHSQSSHQLKFESEGLVKALRVSCPVHPRPIDNDQFAKANRAYLSLSVALFRAVTDQVLHAPHEAVATIVDSFIEQISITYPYNVPKHTEAEIAAARAEIEDVTPLSNECERARQIARERFEAHIGPSSA